MSENKLNDILGEDTIKARREARGRKILENAKSRLEKLSNGQYKKLNAVLKGQEEKKQVFNNDWPTNENENTADEFLKDIFQKIRDQELKEQDKFPDPEIETELEFGPKINFNVAKLQEQYQQNNQNFLWQSQPPTNNNPFGLSNEFTGQQPMMFGNFNQQQNEVNDQRKFSDNLFIKNKLHLIVISILTYIISRIENFTSFSVFLPLLIWELTETFLLKSTISNDVLFSILLLFANLSPKTSTLISKVFGILNKIFKDVGVFVFFFVICHIIAINIF